MEEAIERMVREATASANAEIEEEVKELQNSLCPSLLQWLKTPVNTSASPVAATEQENTAPSNSNSATDEENTAPSNSNSTTEEENTAPSAVLQDIQPHPLTVSHQPHPHSSRFGEPITDDQLQSAIKTRIPKNTKKTTNWGFKVYTDWCTVRDISQPIEQMDITTMNTTLAKFVQETRRRDSKEYPATSLHNIVAAIQRHLRENGRPEISFFNENCPDFDMLRKSLDARMKQLTKKGVGNIRKHAQPITPEMEEKLWQMGIFSRSTGEGLINIVFWYACKMFGLRGADEHRDLQKDQFIIGKDDNGKFLRFVGKSCKNWQGGLHQRKIQPKDLHIIICKT